MKRIIFVDDREDPERIEKLKEHFEVAVDRLDVADIIIPREGHNTIDNIAIEVKTVQDFIASCNNGRIKEEALKMKFYSFNYIIVYDDGKLNPKYSKQSINQKTGNIASLQIRYKTPVFWCKNFNEFVSQINAIINEVEKEAEPIEPPIVRPKDSNQMINVLIGIDGVGKKMAQKLLDEFRTPSGVFMACPEELDQIPRLSRKAKENILRM